VSTTRQHLIADHQVVFDPVPRRIGYATQHRFKRIQRLVYGPIARGVASTSQPIGEAFARSVAVIDQSPVGYVATTGLVIWQSVFRGEDLARSLALTGQAWVDHMGASEP
jgi:hypothetical protein